MKVYDVSFWIPREEMLAFYEGRARRISTLASNGQRLDLPAAGFRRFVDHSGLKGHFRVLVTDDNRLIEIQRLA